MMRTNCGTPSTVITTLVVLRPMSMSATVPSEFCRHQYDPVQRERDEIDLDRVEAGEKHCRHVRHDGVLHGGHQSPLTVGPLSACPSDTG